MRALRVQFRHRPLSFDSDRPVSAGAHDWNGGFQGAIMSPGTRDLELIALMIKHGATNVADVFELPRDHQLILDLVTKSDVSGDVFNEVWNRKGPVKVDP